VLGLSTPSFASPRSLAALLVREARPHSQRHGRDAARCQPGSASPPLNRENPADPRAPASLARLVPTLHAVSQHRNIAGWPSQRRLPIQEPLQDRAFRSQDDSRSRPASQLGQCLEAACGVLRREVQRCRRPPQDPQTHCHSGHPTLLCLSPKLEPRNIKTAASSRGTILDSARPVSLWEFHPNEPRVTSPGPGPGTTDS